MNSTLNIYRHRYKYEGTISANTVLYVKLMEAGTFQGYTLISATVNYPNETIFVSIPQHNNDGTLITRIWNYQNKSISYQLEILLYFVRNNWVEGNDI